jgi:CRP/FNR family transcriptional regulator
MTVATLVSADPNVRNLNGCELCPTRKFCLVQEATPAQQRWLAEKLSCVKPLQSGNHIFRAGAKADAQFHIRSGMVKTYVTTASGEDCVTGFYLPGEILGRGQCTGTYAESAVALSTLSLCRLDAHDVQELGSIGLTQAMFEQLSQQSRGDVQHQVNLRQSSAEKRFAGYCLQYGQRRQQLGLDPLVLPTPMSRTDLASYLGMKLESLSRVISRLQARGLIQARRDQIVVLHSHAIAALADHLRY